LEIAGIAAARAVSEPFLSFVSAADSTDFMCVFMLDFTDVFLTRLFSFCLLLFSADLCVAKRSPPLIVVNLNYVAQFLAEIPAPVKSKVVMDTFLISNIVDFSIMQPIK
jgi:hypothetical protein